jgi:hypothetical protein
LPTNIYVNGQDYDVIILEGIYALDQTVTNILHGRNVIVNFVPADEKTLFIRRILRDKAFASTTFTIKNYFSAVLTAYKKDILPRAQVADIVFFNNMSFKELREGEFESVHKRIRVQSPAALEQFVSKCKVLSKVVFKDHHIGTTPNEESQLIFRSASFDGGKTFAPYSLVQKGHIKLRKDGKTIRPVNLFLDEQQMAQTFKTEQEFFDMIALSDFKQTSLGVKQRTRLQYKDYFVTIDNIKNDGIYVELNGLDLQKENLPDFTKPAQTTTSENQLKKII